MDTLQTLVTTYGSSNSVAKILSSRDEGVYGWLTVNYLINGKYLAAENQVRIFLDPTMFWILGLFFKRINIKTSSLSICTWFLQNSSLKYRVFDENDFFPSLNLIFTACVAYKIPVWNRPKIKFIKLNISNWNFAKIKCR